MHYGVGFDKEWRLTTQVEINFCCTHLNVDNFLYFLLHILLTLKTFSPITLKIIEAVTKNTRIISNKWMHIGYNLHT